MPPVVSTETEIETRSETARRGASPTVCETTIAEASALTTASTWSS